MIETLLIANRGEIACRITRTCRALGIRVVAVYADADANARHVLEADEAVYIGASPPSESYLVIEKIIAAAGRTGADAVHPGFGFLAENADFARACGEAGLIFVGPSPEAIAAMGSKRAAKALAMQVGVPVIPGFQKPDASTAELLRAADDIGYPLMVKAAAGGGGKGMRLVTAAEALEDALQSARREALAAFGSDELILERALTKPRHIEIQVLGDAYGHLIHLGERECSIQRRHQKVIEEAPAPGMTPELRAAMGQAALTLARAVGYNSAGTVEFLLDTDGRFYFLEMNTRLQVEHPVTELVTGIDLVEWQIRIADGAPLTLQQDAVRLAGHAIEARLYAEDPANNFLPVTGDVSLWHEPTGAGIRVDSGLMRQDTVSIHYDPMLAKIIAHGPDRASAARRLRRALDNTLLFGLTTNQAYLYDILGHPAYRNGDLHTGFLAEHFTDWAHPTGDLRLALLVVTASKASGYAWRNNPNRPVLYRYRVDNSLVDVQLIHLGRWQNQRYQIIINDQPHVVQREANLHEEGVTLTVDGYRQRVVYDNRGDRYWVKTRRGMVTFEHVPLLPAARRAADAGGSLRAPMPGLVTAVLVEVGQTVRKGQPLMKLEAMKMEHTIVTAADGVVEAIYYHAGETVEADAQLFKIAEMLE